MIKLISCWLLGLATLLTVVAAGAAQPEPLPPEQAFALAQPVFDGHVMILDYTIAPGYYLYKQRFVFKLEPEAALGTPEFPAGIIKNDPYSGPTEIYHDKLEIRVPVVGKIDPKRVTVLARSQGCAEFGVCYPPFTYRLKFGPAASTPTTDGGILDSLLSKKKNPAQLISRAPVSKSTVPVDGFASAALLGFGGGLVLALTPCLFPLIPILAGIVLSGGGGGLRGFRLCLAYTQGMAVMYALVGAIAGISGAFLGAALQSPWLLGVMALVFVLMALAMFDLIQLQLPVSLQSRFTNTANRLPGGRMLGVFMMGVLAALVVGPCATPVLVGVFSYAQQTASPILGALVFYAFGLGVGLPLLLVGVFGSTLLPQAGAWMHLIRQIFGVMFLGVAIYVVQGVLPETLVMVAWSALAIGSAVFLHALDPLPLGAHAIRRLGKALGVMLLLLGAALLIGVLGGSRDLLAPLRAFAGVATAPVQKTWEVQSVPQLLDQRIGQARGRPVVVDVSASWCGTCREIDREVLPDPAVQAALEPVTALRFDISDSTGPQREWLKRYGLITAPAILIYDAQGRLRHLFNTKPSASELAAQLKEAAS